MAKKYVDVEIRGSYTGADAFDQPAKDAEKMQSKVGHEIKKLTPIMEHGAGLAGEMGTSFGMLGKTIAYAFTGTLGPLGLVIAGVAVLSAGVMALRDHWAKQAEDEKKEIEENVALRKKAVDELVSYYQSRSGNLRLKETEEDPNQPASKRYEAFAEDAKRQIAQKQKQRDELEKQIAEAEKQHVGTFFVTEDPKGAAREEEKLREIERGLKARRDKINHDIGDLAREQFAAQEFANVEGKKERSSVEAGKGKDKSDRAAAKAAEDAARVQERHAQVLAKLDDELKKVTLSERDYAREQLRSQGLSEDEVARGMKKWDAIKAAEQGRKDDEADRKGYEDTLRQREEENRQEEQRAAALTREVESPEEKARARREELDVMRQEKMITDETWRRQMDLIDKQLRPISRGPSERDTVAPVIGRFLQGIPNITRGSDPATKTEQNTKKAVDKLQETVDLLKKIADQIAQNAGSITWVPSQLGGP